MVQFERQFVPNLPTSFQPREKIDALLPCLHISLRHLHPLVHSATRAAGTTATLRYVCLSARHHAQLPTIPISDLTLISAVLYNLALFVTVPAFPQPLGMASPIKTVGESIREGVA